MTRDLLLEPLDGFLFRDGRPFSAGDDHRATGEFPPLPTSFYGALRGTLLSQHGARFAPGRYTVAGPHSDAVRQAVGEPRQVDGRWHVPFGALSLPLVGLATTDGDLLFPLPADVLRRSKRHPNEPDAWAVASPLAPTLAVRSNVPLGNLVRTVHSESDYFGSAQGALVTADAFTAYLRSGQAPTPYVPDTGLAPGDTEIDSPAATLPDPRTSVQIDPASKTAADGALFSVEFLRLRPGLAFAVRAHHAGPLRPSGLLRLGGEARPARYRTAAFTLPSSADVAEAITAAKGHARLVLSSPAPFSAGWRPDGIGPDGTGTLHGHRVTLTGAAVPGSRIVGGWDAALNRPRAARRAAVAGSVYYVRLHDPRDAPAFVDALHGRSLCADPDDARRGLGTAWVGACPPAP